MPVKKPVKKTAKSPAKKRSTARAGKAAAGKAKAGEGKARELMIVESPTKARTISRIVGERFEVQSSMGHIRDLPKSGMSVDIENGFEPSYEVPPDKKKTVAALRKAAKSSPSVWLATDEDREGEAIAWHLAQALRLPASRTRRIVFHEITKSAILEAIEAPRAVDDHVVDAQQARRILDRLVGYELSPVLWRKVMTGLSAGRVQSVAVRLVVEREREIGSFEPAVAYRVTGDFDGGKDVVFTAKLDTDFETEEQARSFLERLPGAVFTVEGLEKKPGRKSPRPPFTTSTLQQEASQKLGFSVKRTMVLAQRLYEAGKITYMRTDSVVMSGVALAQTRKVVTAQFGKEYAQTRQYKTKSKGAQEAHEAIRPTNFGLRDVDGEPAEKKLYGLIWRRALASQMSDARVERTTATVAPSTTIERFVAKGEIVLFDGFLKLYRSESDEEEDGRLPPLVQGQEVRLTEALARQTFSRAPARYTEASLVKKLEEMGIGRPSTYAPTISTVQDRGYVEKRGLPAEERSYRVIALKGGEVSEETRTENAGGEKAKLFPTDVAGVVTDFLVNHFPEVVDYSFTARIEEELDEIARGEKEWRAMMTEFYEPFHTDIEKVRELPREQVSGARELGTDPKSGKPVSVRIGRYGPYVQIGTKDDEEKPKFASLRPGQKLESVTLDEALELFKLPRKLGETLEGEELSTNFGRYGPYVKYGTRYVSIKGHDPMEITREQALELVAAKKEEDAKREIKTFEGSDIKVLNGRYGPYVTDGNKNVKVPKGEYPAELTLEQCEKMIAEAPEKPRRGRASRKKKPSDKPARKKPAKKAKPKPKRKKKKK